MQWCIINGETITGITTMMMDEGLDTGDILKQQELNISPDMTFGELHDAMADLGAKLLVDTLDELQKGTLTRHSQDDALSNYAPMIKKDMGHIDWQSSAKTIHDLVRGLNPFMAAYTTLEGQMLKIWRTKIADICAEGLPGEVVRANRGGLLVKTGDGVLEVLELQAAGKKKMTARDFINGHGLSVSTRLV